MTEGRYLYCIVDDGKLEGLGKVGVLEGEISTIPFRGIEAVVSPVPYKELESSLANIMKHQRVVELVRSKTTVLPVRFGVIFKSEEGVRQLLSKSYSSYKDKLAKLEAKDEYGVKMILSTNGMKLLTQAVGKESPELGKLAKESAKAGKGTAYLLKLKAEEALKAGSLRKLEEVSNSVNDGLSRAAVDSRRLNSDHEQIVLNAAYLVQRGKEEDYHGEVLEASMKVRPVGQEILTSGRWAPYSFC